jgi:anthranilate synthase component 2
MKQAKATQTAVSGFFYLENRDMVNALGRPRLLVLDNYDSFTYNLVQMFRQYPLDIRVLRNDKPTLRDVEEMAPDYILISPGPRNPNHTGISMPVIKAFYQRIPILGVCLGMQCINAVFNGQTVRSPHPTHGKTSRVAHDGRRIFKGIPSPFTVARYHSLMVSPGDASVLTITARSKDNIIMGLSHPQFPLHGVQFHPESFMTDHGYRLVENFLQLGPLKSPKRDCGVADVP